MTNDTPASNHGDYLLAVVAVNLVKSYKNNPRYMGNEITTMLSTDPVQLPAAAQATQWSKAITNAALYMGYAEKD